MKVFISHITEERHLAISLKEWIETTFLGQCEAFVSSSSENIELGSNWLSKIDRALDDCHTVVVLCSPYSISRPWINFEAGCGWIRRVNIIPICHTGLKVNDLPIPLSLFQGINLDSDNSCKKLIHSIGANLGLSRDKIPRINFDEMQKEIIHSALSQFNEWNVHLLDKIKNRRISPNPLLYAYLDDRLNPYLSMPLLSNTNCSVNIYDYDRSNSLISNESILSYRIHRDHIKDEELIYPLRYRQRYSFPNSVHLKQEEWIKKFKIEIGEEKFTENDIKVEKIETQSNHDYICTFEKDIEIRENVDVSIVSEFISTIKKPYETMRARYPSHGFRAALSYNSEHNYDCAWFKLRNPKEPDNPGAKTEYTRNGIYTSSSDWVLPGEGVILSYYSS